MADEEIERLTKEIEDLDRQIAKLEQDIRDREAEINQLSQILAEKNDICDRLARQLGETPVPEPSYKAVKGDLVDEMLAQYINLANCPVPIKRLGGGFYLFGLKKIYAKIMNGKLVIRVGGGYMIIEEFIANYAEQELHKLNKLAEREGVSDFMELDLEYYALGKKGVGSPSNTGKTSPRRSPKAGGKGSPKSSINGSK